MGHDTYDEGRGEMSSQGLLAGKRALVTGAAHGQGRSIVEVFVQAGATVLAIDADTDELNRWAAPLEGHVCTTSLDVTSEEGWRQAVVNARAELGGLDTLVNIAGMLHRRALLDESALDFERLWRVDCLGPFLAVRACAPLLAECDGPSIVNTESVGAAAAFPDHVSYGSSKWALRGLTRFAALDLSAMGIRVNAVLPGSIATPMMLAGDTDLADRQRLPSCSWRSERPAQLAALCRPLSLDEARCPWSSTDGAVGTPRRP
jgi:NAD(P)-dependent dehydrogenase (short-subunit alcohol dehydrogenase family)